MKKKHYLLAPNGIKVPLTRGMKASVFPKELFPRIEGTDENGKPCIFIELKNLFV